MDFKFDLMDDNEKNIVSHNEEDISFLTNKIQNILDIVFDGNSSKCKIHTFSNRISFSCPYCGDTLKNKYKYRGNVFFENWKYKCFNCGTHKKLQDFILDFKSKTDISNTDYWKLISFKSKNYASINEFFEIENYKDFFIVEYQKWSDKNNLISVLDHPEALKYLQDRLIPEEFLKKLKFNKQKNCIIIPNTIKYNDIEYLIAYSDKPLKIFKNTSKYILHNFSSIFKYDEKFDMSNYQNFDYISNMYRFFDLNLNNKIIICEGYFDSLFLKNSCALSGANKKVPFEGEFYYLFDNDNTGNNLSIKYLKESQYVFKWKQFINDFKLPSKIKDINECVIKLKEKNINFMDIDIYSYFTNQKIDLYWI